MPYKNPAAHQEKKKASNAIYRTTHLEERKAYDRAYNVAHREERQAYFTAYRAAHREERNARHAAWRAAHREELKIGAVAYRAAYPEKTRAYAAAYHAAHPEVHRIALARREARKKALPATLTTEQWLAIKRAYRHRCAYCGMKEGKTRRLTQDHVNPLSKGGGTTADNIVPACSPCNSHKYNGLPPSVPPIRLLI